VVLVANLEKLRKPEGRIVVVRGPGGVVHVQYCQPVGVTVRERLDQDVLDDAENHRGRANPQGQGEDGQQRETTIAAKPAQCVTHILCEPA